MSSKVTTSINLRLVFTSDQQKRIQKATSDQFQEGWKLYHPSIYHLSLITTASLSESEQEAVLQALDYVVADWRRRDGALITSSVLRMTRGKAFVVCELSENLRLLQARALEFVVLSIGESRVWAVETPHISLAIRYQTGKGSPPVGDIQLADQLSEVPSILELSARVKNGKKKDFPLLSQYPIFAFP
jgi:hypothetical protein